MIAGYAKLPANITSEEVYHTIALVVVIDMRAGTIINAECSVVTQLAKDFISGLLVGYNMNDGADGLIDRLDSVYFGQVKKALITALKMVFAKYTEIVAGEGE